MSRESRVDTCDWSEGCSWANVGINGGRLAAGDVV